MSKGGPGISNPGELKASVLSEPRSEVKLSDRKTPLKARLIGKFKGGKKVSSSAEASLASDQEGAGLPASLLDPLAVYRFKMVSYRPTSSSAGGNLVDNFSCDPGTTTFLEYTTLVALFSEVRLAKATLSIMPQNPHSDAMASTDLKYAVRKYLPVTWDDQLVNSLPTSVNSVIDNARVWFVHLGRPSVNHMVVETNDRAWAPTGSAAPGPYAGCTGQFSFYQSGLTVSYPYVDTVLAVEFEFRNRI